MAKGSTVFGMFDMTKMTLQQVNQTLNINLKLINEQNKLNSSGGRAGGSLQKVKNDQNKLNNSFDRGEKTSGGLLGKVKGLAIEHVFEAIKKGIDLTIVGAAKLERQVIDVNNMFGDKDIGTAFFDQINAHALNSQYGVEQFANITREFIPFTTNTDKLMELDKLSERLAILNPTQGLEGAGNALKEMLNGNGMSLENGFRFDPNEIKALEDATNMDDFVNKLDNILNKKGGTQLAVEEVGQSATILWDNLGANILTSFAKAGNSALEVMKPALQALNEAFREGKFQPFFNGLATGLSFVVDIIMLVATFISDNIGIIQTVIVGLAITAIAYALLVAGTWIAANIAYATTAIGCALLTAQAWIIAHWPLLVMIAIILVLIGVMMSLGITAEQVVGFIGGIFGVTVGVIYNLVAMLWNVFASFAEFLVNVFNHPLYSIKTLFFNIWNSIVGFVGKALDGIVGMVKKVPFLKDLVGDFSFENSLRVDPGPAPKDYWKAPKMEMKDYGNEFKFGYGKGAGIANGIGNMFSTPDLSNISKKANLDAWNKKQGPGQLNNVLDNNKNLSNPADNRFSNAGDKNLSNGNKHLESIDDKIDVSNEHLEMLRDLAEMESMQNFVTLTPTVQVTTGDIKEEADINKIIDKIETYMENELVNSAEGVYA